MKKPLTLALAVALLTIAACNRSAGNLRRDQQNYEVIQEGAATGVTSTLGAPGETPPPMPTLTSTNADTTTAFTLPNTTVPTAPNNPPGTIAGSLPQPATWRDSGLPRNPARSRPVTPPPTEPAPQTPPVTDTAPMTPAPEPTAEPAPPPPTTATQVPV